MTSTGMTRPDDWGNLEAKFEQLRKESAINPPLNPAGRLKAVWYPKTEPDEEWSFEYWGGDDGLGVTDRYKWLGCEAAALLGFSGMDDTAAIAYWLTELERNAPKAYKKAHRFSSGSDGADELYCVELFDLCGLSAWFCRKCRADIIRQAARVETVNAPGAMPSPLKTTAQSGRQHEPAAIFRRDGDMWTLRFNGETKHVQHYKGVGYIAELIRRPNIPIEATELAGLVLPANVPVNPGSTTATRANFAPELGIEKADPEAIANVRNALVERQVELTELPRDFSTSDRRAKLEDEIARLEQYLSEVVNDKGQPRKENGIAQRVRPAVTKAIREAIEKITERHPDLGNHLQTSIRTGTVMMYEKEPAVLPDWSF